MGTLVFFFVPFICYPVVSAARKLLKDGMNFDDVGSALVIDARARSEETEVFRQAFVGLLRKFRRPDWSPILNLRKESGPNGDPKPAPLGHRFLAGPAGRLFFRIARVGLKTVPQTTSPAGDRTEVVLASAADSVFAALPREHRGRLAEVPEIIRRLQVDAEALREREVDLAKVLADVGGEGIERDRTRLEVLRADPDKQSEADLLARRLSMIEDVESERSRVSNRLGTVVAALENVRINLLRLRAGLASIEEITADLEAARRICDDLDHEVEARTEVDQITEAAHGQTPQGYPARALTPVETAGAANTVEGPFRGARPRSHRGSASEHGVRNWALAPQVPLHSPLLAHLVFQGLR